MNSSSLNLARSQRPQNFDEIVGQDLAVRLVKNSLYRNKLFPVYLLAGQRGCGKTTLARVFAAAINCEQRENFSKNPKETALPCQVCPSCQAMKQGCHPDFNEIDAASHTGVDNIRSLIDAATFLPGLGQKKIYLIDEAHMLSKAAFNAFLKIMEEPPATVTFMLATTDPQKIIETVRSRCFQLFFHPLPPQQLHDYLAHTCTQKNITFESEALFLIAQESEGSVRDALNRLEQIYLAHGSVTYRDTLAILGDISFEQLINLCTLALKGDHNNLIQTLQAVNLKQYSATQVWKKTVDLLHAALWFKNGTHEERFEPYKEQLAVLAQVAPMHHFLAVLDQWYRTEPLFTKTQSQEILLESLFMRMAQTAETLESKKIADIRTPSQKTAPTLQQTNHSHPQQAPIIKEEPVATPSTTSAIEPTPAAESKITPVSEHAEWNKFLTTIGSKDDPLVLSIFKQAHFVKYENSVVRLEFEEQHSFFKDLIDQTKPVWHTVLHDTFGANTTIELAFIASKSTQQSNNSASVAKPESHQEMPIAPAIKPASHVESELHRPTTRYTKPIQQPSKMRLDVRDREHWKQVNLILDMFPGTVTEEKDITHE